jgi:tRNA uracil 4-sulfurtransferase
MTRYLIIHYGEIGLKKGNKSYFEDALKNNINSVLGAIGLKGRVSLMLSRLMVKLPAKFDEELIRNTLMHVPGIQNFGFYYCVDEEKLEKEIVARLPREEITERGDESFCVRVKKVQGEFKKNTPVMERDLGAELLRNDINLKVKMKNADRQVFVELIQGKAYFCYDRITGIGGLPSGTGGRLLSLISSGFDSPVASYMMMRRGARVHFVHFSGQPYSDRDELEHVKEIVEILAKYQGGAKLIVIPFGEIQKKLSTNLKVPAKDRVILYRRLMLRIAQKVAVNVKARGLVTGESFGQVASQTLPNMAVIDESTSLPIFRPVIGLDKEQIVDFSRRIGTHDISKQPCSDTCGLFMPKSPALAAKLPDIKEIEESIDIKGLVKEALDEKDVLKIGS